MFAAFSADDAAARAGAREIIEHVLDGRFRDALLALTDSLPPAERLRAAAAAVSVSAAEPVLAAEALTTRTPAEVARTLAAVVLAMREDRNVLLAGIARGQLGRPEPGPARVEETPRVAS
jgi:hypothetical protein